MDMQQSMAASVFATSMPRTEQAPEASGSLRMLRSVGDCAIVRKISLSTSRYAPWSTSNGFLFAACAEEMSADRPLPLGAVGLAQTTLGKV
jgi:hypothetical protein